MERRKFIQACAVLLGSNVMIAGCGSSGDSDDSLPTSTSGSSASALHKDRWMELPSTQFSVAHDTFGAIDMELTGIEDDYYDPQTEQFSIILTGPDTPFFEEGIYETYNDSLGYIKLFIQPSLSAPGDQKYRGIFSLLV